MYYVYNRCYKNRSIQNFGRQLGSNKLVEIARIMRSIILKFFFLLFTHYKGSENYQAYYQAVISSLIILFVSLAVFCLMFDLVAYMPYGPKSVFPSGFGTSLSLMGMGLVYVVFINLVFKEKDVIKVEMGETEKRRGYFIIIAYLVILFALFIILPFYKKGLI